MPIDLSMYNQAPVAQPIDSFLRAMQGVQQMRAQQENIAGLREQRDAIAEERRARAAALAKATADQAAMDNALRLGGGVRGTTLAAALQGAPHTVPALTEFFDKSEKSAAEIQKLQTELNDKRLEHMGMTASEVLKHGVQSLGTALAWHAEQFPQEADAVAKLGERLKAMPPEEQTAFLERARDAAPSAQEIRRKAAERGPLKVTPGETVLDPTTNQPVYTAPPKEEHSAAYKEWQDAASTGYKGSFTQYQNEDANRKKPTITVNPMMSATDPHAIAEGIRNGTMSPELGGYGRGVAGAVASDLAKSGYNHTAAITDWKATQKHVATMNGAQQLRLNQAVNSLPDMLDSVDALASKWKGGRFPLLNNVTLKAAKGGLYGTEAASIANQLDAQIADVTADLGNVYMGGNSPTDHALGLAGKSLQGSWDEKVLHDMVKLAKANVTIRKNSIANTGVAGASATNPYSQSGAAPAAAPTAAPAGDRVRVKGPNDETGTVPKGSAMPPGWSVVGG